MKYFVHGALVLGLAAGLAGCASILGGSAGEGREAFASMRKAVVQAGHKIEPGIALIGVSQNGPAAKPANSMMMMMGGGGGPVQSAGLVLTKEGHILSTAQVKPDSDSRITVWIGDTEYLARQMKTDAITGFSILKIDPREPLATVNFSNTVDLGVGEWAVAVVPTDEDNDFARLTSIAACRGEIAGRYRHYQMSGFTGAMRGAPMVDMKGRLAGILLGSSDALAVNDLRADVGDLLAQCKKGGSTNDADKSEGWFGAILEPINKDYAQLKKLPTSAMTVLHAAKDSPAAAVGMKDGDIITGLNGQPLRFTGKRIRDYFYKSLRMRVGAPFSVTVLRDGRSIDWKGTIAKKPETVTLRAEDIGVTVTDFQDFDVYAMNLGHSSGVLVTEVHRGSAAATGSSFRSTLLSQRDIIVEIGGFPTPNVAEFSKALERIRKEHRSTVLVKYYRGRMTGYAGINLKLGNTGKGDET